MRHSKILISEIIQMRKDGLTLTEIQQKTQLPKTTVFHHVQSIPKSDVLKSKLRLISQELQKRVADSRRGKSLKDYTFIRPEKWEPEFVNLLAHFLFDGDIRRTSCCYNNRNLVLIRSVQSLMSKVLGVDDHKLYKDSRTGVFKLCYFNVEIATFVSQKSKDLLRVILDISLVAQLAFLKSFFDDEGCIDFKINKNRREIRGYQHSLKILSIIKILLKNIGIDGVVDRKYFEIVVSRKENLLKFQDLINFTPGVTVNGKRSNSIWKKNLEKREILRMALESYQK